MFVTSDVDISDKFDKSVTKCRTFKTESFQDYLDSKKCIGVHNFGWIHRIIDGYAEQEKNNS